MKQLAEQLRRFADEVERGKQFDQAMHCAIVLGNNAERVQATYIGPVTGAQAKHQGIGLLTGGIMSMSNDLIKLAGGSSTKRST